MRLSAPKNRTFKISVGIASAAAVLYSLQALGVAVPDAVPSLFMIAAYCLLCVGVLRAGV